MKHDELDQAFNGTHVADTPIIGVHKYFEQRYISFYYSIFKGVERLELYFRNSLNGDFYTSRCYLMNQVPEKYKPVLKDLKTLFPRLNELPADPQMVALGKADTIKVEMESFKVEVI